MGKVIAWTSVLVLFLALFQAAILSNLAFLPAMPDLVLIAVVYVAFMNGSLAGSTAGFISGFVVDFLSAAPVGLHSFVRAVAGFAVGKFSGSFNLNRVAFPALMGFAATVCKAAQVWVLSLFFGEQVRTYRLVGADFWLEALVNAVAAPILFAILGLFDELFVARERRL